MQKNSFINVSGFSPHQLVFGRNISINDKINSDPNSADPLATNDQPQANDSISELTNQLSNININDQDTSTLYNNKVSNKEKLKLKKRTIS